LRKLGVSPLFGWQERRSDSYVRRYPVARGAVVLRAPRADKRISVGRDEEQPHATSLPRLRGQPRSLYSRPRERLPQAGEYHKVSVNPDAIQATDAKRCEAVLAL
jgi:hypothetical protein